ncbi:Cellulose synthase A catalytic subunit 8 [UDP-forming] [Linum perenne]
MKNNNLNTYHAAAASSSSPVIHQLSNSRDFDESIDIVSTYSVHIPPTPNNQPMVEMQISVRGGGASSFCQVPGCDAVVEESSFPCVCEFRICRDCFNDADGVCPGCHMSYHREAGRIEHPAGGGNEFDSLDSDFLFKKDYGYGGGGIINSISHEHVICELWFSFSWLLDQLPKLCPVKRGVDLELLKEKFETPNPENPAGKSDLPGVDFFVSTADPEKEPPLVTANTILSILAADYPVEKLSCYVSDDGGALLTFEAMAEAASFARLWVPFCRKHYVEPRNPESYFNLRKDPYKGKVRADFVRDRRRVKREYDEFKVRVNGLPNSIRRRSDAYNTHEEIKMMKKVKRGGDGDGDDDEPMMMIERVKIPKATWMADGTHWAGTWITPSPDHTRGDHASIIQEPTKGSRSDGNSMDLSEVDIRLPMLVYVSREKRPGYDHNKKAGAMNALVRASAVMSNGPFILNLDCDHYIYNSEALREGMCFMMDADGDEISYVQFPQRFEGIDPSDRYANHNTVFFDVNMLALDGIQGPVYVGTGCLFRRTAIYGFEPPNSAKERKKSGKKRSSSSYDGGDDDDDDDDAVNIAPLIPKKFVTEDVVTGFRMHEKGWRSVYCMTKRDAFRGTAPINLTDRLHQVLRWATGSVEIFFSRNNALLAGTKLKFLQRIAYLNVGIYPFTSVFLLLYCFLPALSLFADQFIVDSLDVDFLAYLLTITITSTLLAVLEIKWSGIALEEWWRNEQFWLIGGTSAHLAAVLQGLLKVIAGIEISFTLTSKSAADEDDEFAELYVIKWTSLMIPPCTIIIVNIVAIAVGLIRTIYSDAPRWNNLLGGAFFSFWVLVHLYPFAKGLMGRRRKTPTIVFVWSALISICISLLWVAVNPPAGQNQIGGSF